MDEAAVAQIVRDELARHQLGQLVRQLGGRLRSGAGSPESVVVAPVGTLWVRSDGGAATTLYVKESGAGSTGWVAK